MSNASAGVPSRRSNAGELAQPAAATTVPNMVQKPVAEPKDRRAASMSPRPAAWAITTVDAMPKPNTTENIRNIVMFALAVAASACAPRNRPTQIALIDPFSDWSTLDARVGMANNSKDDAMGPFTKSLASRSLDAILRPFPAFRASLTDQARRSSAAANLSASAAFSA